MFWANEKLTIARRLVFIFPDFTFSEEQIVNDYAIELCHKTIAEAKLYVNVSAHSDMMEFVPVWPRLGRVSFRGTDVDHINVSQKRSNTDIARDVTGRLLASYFSALPTQVALKQAAIDRDQKQKEQIVHFHTMLGKSPPATIGGDTFYSLGKGIRLLQFSPDGQSIRIETAHLSANLVEEICQLIIKNQGTNHDEID